MFVGRYDKVTTSDEDYGIDWSKELVTGETVLTSSWTAPDGLTVIATASAAVSTTVWLTGGTPGTWYDVVNTITTSAGRTYVGTIAINCVPK